MTRQQDAVEEERRLKQDRVLVRAVRHGLERAVLRAGGEFTGFTAKINPVECLLVIKAVFPAGPMVAFVGSSDLAAAIVKAEYEAGRDNLRWKKDRYVGQS